MTWKRRGGGDSEVQNQPHTLLDDPLQFTHVTNGHKCVGKYRAIINQSPRSRGSKGTDVGEEEGDRGPGVMRSS